MKRLLITLTMLAALSAPQDMTAKGHAQQQADTMAIEAVSDTTDDEPIDTAMMQTPNSVTFNTDFDVEDILHDFDRMFGGMAFAATVLFILFVLAPIAILGLIGYFIYKYRKQKIQLAEMAIKNGQPLPHDTKPDKAKTPDDYWKSGIKNFAIGLGLAAACYFIGFDLIAAIGIFIAIYGAGQMATAKTSVSKQSRGKESNDTATELTDENRP